MPMHTEHLLPSPALLSLLQLSSPGLPIGAFAYSQGLEAAVETGLVKDQASLMEWLQICLRHGLANLDLPVIRQLFLAWQNDDQEQLLHWQQVLLANRETAELVQEELQLGKTFSRLLESLELAPEQAPQPSVYLCMYACAAHKLSVPLESALVGFVWSWLENQVTVACKTIPLGQTPAQQTLLQLQPCVQEALDTALALPCEQIGLTLPGLTMVSAWHEHQYSRLFRS